MTLLTRLRDRLRATPRQLVLYLLVSATTGLFMNWFGHTFQLGWFKHWFQVFTCYWGWMVPFALLLRGLPWHAQIAYGALAMIPLELVGYALGSTVAAPDDVSLVARVLGRHNVALAMVAFFCPYFLLFNLVVAWLDRVLPGGPARNAAQQPQPPAV